MQITIDQILEDAAIENEIEENTKPEHQIQIEQQGEVFEVEGLRYSHEPVEGWVQIGTKLGPGIFIYEPPEKHHIAGTEWVYINPSDLTAVCTNMEREDEETHFKTSWAFRDIEGDIYQNFGPTRKHHPRLGVEFKNPGDYWWVRGIVREANREKKAGVAP